MSESSAEGRQRRCRRNLRWQAVPHPRDSNRKCSAANSEPEAGRRTNRPTWQVPVCQAAQCIDLSLLASDVLSLVLNRTSWQAVAKAVHNVVMRYYYCRWTFGHPVLYQLSSVGSRVTELFSRSFPGWNARIFVTFIRWPRSFGLCHPNLIRSIIIVIITGMSRERGSWNKCVPTVVHWQRKRLAVEQERRSLRSAYVWSFREEQEGPVWFSQVHVLRSKVADSNHPRRRQQCSWCWCG